MGRIDGAAEAAAERGEQRVEPVGAEDDHQMAVRLQHRSRRPDPEFQAAGGEDVRRRARRLRRGRPLPAVVKRRVHDDDIGDRPAEAGGDALRFAHA